VTRLLSQYTERAAFIADFNGFDGSLIINVCRDWYTRCFV